MPVSVLGVFAAAPAVVHPTLLAIAEKKQNSSSGYVLYVVIAVVAVLFFVSSRRKRARMLAAPGVSPLTPGTEVLTRVGAIGTVVEVTNDHVLVEMAPGVNMRWSPDAVARVATSTVQDVPLLDTDDSGANGTKDFDPQRLPPEDRPPLP